MRRGIIVAAALLFSSAARAQDKPVTIPLPDGREIYVAGLRNWTVQMIQDSLAKHGESLTSHTCAEVLRYKLGFPDASAITVRQIRRGAPDVIFVDVREPQDSARVKYRIVPLDTVPQRKEWLAATNVLSESPGVFHQGVSAFLGTATLRSRDTAAAAVAAFFKARTKPSDKRDALQALAKSPSQIDRSVAALILANFPDGTEVWRALLETMRENDGRARQWAALSLRFVATAGGRAPDWHALAPIIHPLLDGTSVGVLQDLIAILNSRPDIGPTFAGPFLAKGGEMLLNSANHPQPMRYEPARALLFKLRGQDFMDDIPAWRKWVLSLRADGEAWKKKP